MSKIRVFLIDDHPVLRSGIGNLLNSAPDIELVGEADNGHEGIQKCIELSPDVLLLDMELPGIPGNEVAAELRNSGVNCQILALSAHTDRQYIQGLLSNGISGYLVKDEAPGVIVDAIRGVARGEQGWMSRQVTQMLIDWKYQTTNSAWPLTPREMEILQEVVTGKTNREISFKMGISEKTVEKHMEAIFSKLNVSSRVEAAVKAIREGMVESTI